MPDNLCTMQSRSTWKFYQNMDTGFRVSILQKTKNYALNAYAMRLECQVDPTPEQ